MALHGGNAMNDESLFERHRKRLNYLELWRELAIRPNEDECDEDDLELLQHEIDDCPELMKKCVEARCEMNNHLPPHEHALDDDLVPARSLVDNAGMGLFFRPASSSCRSKVEQGEVICYYAGHIHNFHSSTQLKDTSYLMLVAGDILVDPGPLPRIKARYINDPLNDSAVNCIFKPEPAFCRCAVVATRDIAIGEELFVSYGEAYWANQDCQGTIHIPGRGNRMS